jgi:hypothetical protein
MGDEECFSMNSSAVSKSHWGGETQELTLHSFNSLKVGWPLTWHRINHVVYSVIRDKMK